jgi:hypothetical protein
MNMALAIKWKYPQASSQHDYKIANNGDGQFVSEWNLQEPQPTETELQEWWLEHVRSVKINELKLECEQGILTGFTSSVTGYTYQFDYKDQDNITQQMLFLVNDPTITTVDWKTIDSGIVTHTREQFLAVCSGANDHKRMNMGKYWTKESQVNSATTEVGINAVVWTEGLA